jgi:predicted enzyme related to lactoylglutathione lyase
MRTRLFQEAPARKWLDVTMADWIEYPPGTPSWVDLTTSDVDAAAGFYGSLFGWETVEAGPVEETGGYRMFTLDGALVAGLSPMVAVGQSPAWTTYISSADADATAAAVRDAGGSVMVPPLEVMTAGRMGAFADAAGGAVFGVWQPREHRGAQVANRVGALTWNELDTHDPAAAQEFYGAVFGWAAEPLELEGQVVYYSWKLDGRTIGGMLPMGEDFPPEARPSWLAYFGVGDLDAASVEVEKVGGRPIAPRREMPAGAFTVFADPQGAVFACWQGEYEPPPG